MTPEEYAVLKEYMDSGNYLPYEMRDFHDGKDLFKTIGARDVGSHGVKEEINFRQGMIYTIDHFLYFMAQHGFELRRVRKNNKIPRFDLDEAIKKNREESAEVFRQMLNQRLSQTERPNEPANDAGISTDRPEESHG